VRELGLTTRGKGRIVHVLLPIARLLLLAISLPKPLRLVLLTKLLLAVVAVSRILGWLLLLLLLAEALLLAETLPKVLLGLLPKLSLLHLL